jgi:hypothetical protein
MAVVVDNEWWLNKRGAKIHIDLIREDEKLKDSLVEELVKKALEVQECMREFKKEAIGDIDSYYELLLEKYKLDAKERSKKGNLTLENFSGTRKITISVNEKIDFDEKLNIAKEKLDVFIKEVTEGVPDSVKQLIDGAFEVDKKGKVNAKKILEMKKLNVEHPLWREAMDIIDEAVQVVGSKSYIRFYYRESSNKPYKNIPLDMANI